MKLPGLSILKDKWVWIGLAAGAGVYLFTNSQHPHPMIHHYKKKKHHGQGGGGMGPGGGGYGQFPDYDRPGLYEVPNKGFENLRFSGQAELQRRLTVT